MVPSWVEGYRHARYRLGGRGPEEFDCYGLPRQIVRDRAGIELPALVEGCEGELDRRHLAGLIAGRERGWVRVADREALHLPLRWHHLAKPLDFVLMRTGRFVCHCGILVAPRLVLHIEAGRGVHVDRLDQVDLAPRVVALYRHPDLT